MGSTHQFRREKLEIQARVHSHIDAINSSLDSIVSTFVYVRCNSLNHRYHHSWALKACTVTDLQTTYMHTTMILTKGLKALLGLMGSHEGHYNRREMTSFFNYFFFSWLYTPALAMFHCMVCMALKFTGAFLLSD